MEQASTTEVRDRTLVSLACALTITFAFRGLLFRV